MAREIIDIGVDDSSGDTIKEAFEKVENNFADIYTNFGTGIELNPSVVNVEDDETPSLGASLDLNQYAVYGNGWIDIRTPGQEFASDPVVNSTLPFGSIYCNEASINNVSIRNLNVVNNTNITSSNIVTASIQNLSVSNRIVSNSDNNIIRFSYINNSSFPVASSFPGLFAFSSSNRIMHFSDGLSWVQLATTSSPSLTGAPTSTTPTSGDNSTRIATTAFVVNELSFYARINSPSFTGNPTAPTPLINDNSNRIATTAFVQSIQNNSNNIISSNLSLYARINSPSFTGNPTAPTPPLNDNDNSIANTHWVNNKLNAASVPRWAGSNKFVSTSAPLQQQGVNGDIWFQIEA
jgi:hypothetical protein